MYMCVDASITDLHMYLRMFVYACVCVCVRTRAIVLKHDICQESVCLCLHVCPRSIHVYTYAHTHMHTHTHSHKHTCTHAYVHTRNETSESGLAWRHAIANIMHANSEALLAIWRALC